MYVQRGGGLCTRLSVGKEVCKKYAKIVCVCVWGGGGGGGGGGGDGRAFHLLYDFAVFGGFWAAFVYVLWKVYVYRQRLSEWAYF